MACFTLKFYFSDRRLCHRECQIKLSRRFQPLLGFGERWSICCLGSRKVRNPWRPKRLHLQSRVSNYWMYFVFKMCMYGIMFSLICIIDQNFRFGFQQNRETKIGWLGFEYIILLLLFTFPCIIVSCLFTF